MKETNPLDRPCCANCGCLMVTSKADDTFRRFMYFTVTDSCPHKNGRPFKMWADFPDAPLSQKVKDQYVYEVSALFDFVCNSWEGRGEPINLDEK